MSTLFNNGYGLFRKSVYVQGGGGQDYMNSIQITEGSGRAALGGIYSVTILKSST